MSGASGYPLGWLTQHPRGHPPAPHTGSVEAVAALTTPGGKPLESGL